MLGDLITSKVRTKILGLFFSDPETMLHVREIVRRLREEINAVRRELSHLEKSGIVKKEPRANRLYYRLNKSYPYYFDLLEINSKTQGLGLALIKEQSKLGKIKFAMFSGAFIRGRVSSSDNVDLLVVGRIVLPELAALVRGEEAKRGHEINYTVMSEEEFVFRKNRHDPFLTSILAGSRVMIIGDEEELVK
jgi:DNA-binding transcriptional ArsR family regulator